MRSLTVRISEETEKRLASKAMLSHCSKAEYIRRQIERDEPGNGEWKRAVACQLPALYYTIRKIEKPEIAEELERTVSGIAEALSHSIDLDKEVM